MTIEQQPWTYAPEWQRDAACNGTDPEIFFPEPGSGNAAIAKRICRDCPVQLDCGLWAIDTDQPIGIFGGMTANQRKRRTRELNQLLAARRRAA